MRAELRSRLGEYMAQIRAADISEVPVIKSTFFKWYNSVSGEDRVEMAPFWDEVNAEAWDIIREIENAFEEIKAIDDAELAAEVKK